MQLNSVDLLLLKILLHWFDSPKLFHSLSLTHTSDFYDYLALPLPCCLCFLPTPFLLCFVTFLNTSANDSSWIADCRKRTSQWTEILRDAKIVIFVLSAQNDCFLLWHENEFLVETVRSRHQTHSNAPTKQSSFAPATLGPQVLLAPANSDTNNLAGNYLIWN
jgi:hypothetical protein